MSEVTLAPAMDCRLISTDAISSRMMEWSVTAPPASGTKVRPPLNIALVLDRSGSMGEDRKMAHVQAAARHVLGLLAETDRVALVSFDDRVEIPVPSAPAGRDHKMRVAAAIGELAPRNCTNLGAGWLTGAQQVADSLIADGLNRVLLLSDGLANQGITSPEELAHHAYELRTRGVSVSTFGVGLSFDEHLMAGIAEAGGGHYYYIERSADCERVFASELGEMLETAARRVTIEFTATKGATIELLGGLPHTVANGSIRHELGALCSGERRAIYLRVLTPAGAAGESIEVRGRLTYLVGDDELAVEAAAAFAYAAPAEVGSAPVDAAVRSRAGEIDMERVVRDALQRERGGDVDGARNILTASLAANVDYLSEQQQTEYGLLSEQISRRLSDAERKARHAMGYGRRYQRRS